MRTEALSGNRPAALPHLRLLQKAPKLRERTSRSTFEVSLERVRRHYGLSVYGYVVMPEHFHLLVNEPEQGTLSRVMQS